MASQIYNEIKRALLAGEIDLDANTFKLALLMTNTTADTENDGKAFVGDFTTLDECDGANYVRKTLASLTVTKDDANDRAAFDAADVTWTALGNGTRAVQGALLFKFVTNDAASIPVAWIEFATTQNPGGSDFTIQWAATGIVLLT